MSNIISSSRLLDAERVSQEETLKYQSEPLPSKQDVLSYLDWQVVVPTDSRGVSVSGSTPLTLKKESIEGLAIKHDDPVYIIVTLTFKSDRGPYAIEILINYGPSDGRYVFGSFGTRKAAKQ